MEYTISGVKATKSAGVEWLGITWAGMSEKFKGDGPYTLIPHYRKIDLAEVLQLS